MGVILLYFAFLNKNIKFLILIIRPDTFIDTAAEESGFLVPRPGTFFLVQYTG